MMFNATEILIDAFVEQIRQGYRRTYGCLKNDYQDIIAWAGNMALENIANSDALYHNVEHSILVTLVGQEILRGKHIREGGVSSEDWLHCMISLLCHDIGYVKGVCSQDREEESLYATGKDGKLIHLLPGASDASLTPYHVDRAKLFIEERFGGHKLIDTEVIKKNIELTRFPIPSAEDHQQTDSFAGLVRSADLIGQLSDPRYLKKITSLFYEFEETGMTKVLGYKTPADVRKNYAKFYWNGVYPYIQDALRFLSLTQQGKQILANLYSNVFVVEHERHQTEQISTDLYREVRSEKLGGASVVSNADL